MGEMTRPLVPEDENMEDISEKYGSMMGTDDYHAVRRGAHKWLYTDGIARMFGEDAWVAPLKDIFILSEKKLEEERNPMIVYRICSKGGEASVFAYGSPIPPDYDKDELLAIYNYETCPLPDGQALLKTVYNQMGRGGSAFILCLALED